MDSGLQALADKIQAAENITAEEKDFLLKDIKGAEKAFALTAFKLDRAEKDRHSLSVMLQETVEDLEKKNKAIEVKNKELEIEAALERVRAASIAMRSSSEIGGIIFKLYAELTKLHARLDRCFIMIVNPENSGITWWLSGKEGLLAENGFFIPMNQHPTHLLYLDYCKKRTKKWQYIFGGEEKKAWDEFGFSETDLAKLPLFIKEDMAAVQKIHLSGSSDCFGSLVTGSLEPLADEHQEIISRFTIAFNQAYARFLDLQKAEAQAREAQIELALERIRARTMAMHKSDELPETSHILFEQIKELGEPVEQLTIGIVNEENNVIEISATLLGDTLKKIHNHSIHEPYMMAKVYKAWKQQQRTLVVELRGDELNKYNQYRNELTNSEMFPTNLGNEHRRIVYAAFFSKGMLALGANEERPPESLQLLVKFASVFDLTYTRFLDLQKAETQAREAQIEAALERVRGKTMAMQNQQELQGVMTKIFEELQSLGFQINACSIIIFNKENFDSEYWLAGFEGKNVPRRFYLPYLNHPYFHAQIDAWQDGITYNTIQYLGELNSSMHDWFDKNGFYEGMPEENKNALKNWEGWHTSNAYMAHGLLSVAANDPLPADKAVILQRFAKVFEQTYTRFLDLQKAEIQARESDLEKKRSEELLLNILPREIANELKQFGKSYARKHEQVSILFTDIKGFSTISETLSAEELVNQLDECFRAFDNIVGKHGLEKIKTIGDAYVCACGLPNPDPDNAVKTIRAAIDMLDFAKGFAMTKIIQDLPGFEFRFGIHTGPVITGVVGLKKFTYDIWGDAVNMAARMEQHGEAGKINISGNTYQLVKDKFICTHRGKIAAKNKGDVDMYFVERKKD